MEVRFDKIENPLKELLLKYKLDQSSYTLRDYNNKEAAVMRRRQGSAITIATESDFAHYSDVESVKNLDNGKYIPLLNAYYERAEKLEKGLDQTTRHL